MFFYKNVRYPDPNKCKRSIISLDGSEKHRTRIITSNWLYLARPACHHRLSLVAPYDIRSWHMEDRVSVGTRETRLELRQFTPPLMEERPLERCSERQLINSTTRESGFCLERNDLIQVWNVCWPCPPGTRRFLVRLAGQLLAILRCHR